MPQNSATRKKIENIIKDVYSYMDKSGLNWNKYKEAFDKMDDKAFFKWVEAFEKNPKLNFHLEVLPFKNEPDFSQIDAALKYLDVPFEEYVYFPDEALDGKPIRSKIKVPVGYCFMKRLQQMVSKKTQISTSVKQRSMINGQVTGDSKVSRNSDVESYALILQNENETLKELLGPRADNSGQRRAMYNSIARDGYVRRKDLEASDSVFEKAVLNTLDCYMLGAGIKSDLITDDNSLPCSIKSNV